MKNKILLVGLFCCSLVSTEAQVLLDKNAGKNSFPIVSPAANVVVCFDGKDETVVRKSVTLFADDVRRVTGQDLKTQASNPGDVSARYAIIVGTVGKSAWINALVAKKKIDTTPITGGWERYMIETVDNPAPGIKKAIVVAGSDRRGTAYGLLSISKAIGVSPWYWWADAPIKQQKNWLSTFINSFQKNLLSSSEVSLSMTKTGDFIAGQRTIMRKNVETSDRKHTRRFVSYCSVFRQIICVRPCTMRLWHFIVYRRIDW